MRAGPALSYEQIPEEIDDTVEEVYDLLPEGS
jgi:hypothetical protein